MKSKWLAHNFQLLKDGVNETNLSDEKKYQFNKILMKIYEAIQAYESMEEENMEYKQVIFEYMKKVNDSLEKDRNKLFSKFFDKKL